MARITLRSLILNPVIQCSPDVHELGHLGYCLRPVEHTDGRKLYEAAGRFVDSYMHR